MGLELILGIGIVGLLLAYLFFKSNDDKGLGGHFLLRLMLLGCLFGIFVLLGKASMDSTETCELVHNYTDNTYVYGNSLFYENGTARYHWEYEPASTPPGQSDVDQVRLFHIREYKDYDVVCFKNTSANTGVTFYTLTLWIVRLISAYLLIYFFYELFLWLSKIIKGKRGRTK